MRAPFFLAILLVGSLLAGCTDKLTPSSDGGATGSSGFSVTPEKGGKDTVFTVDAGKLAAKSVNLTWDFGDGTVAYGARAEHVYGFTNGVMTITLFATDAAGKQGISMRTVTLGSGENQEPKVTVRAARSWIEANQPVNLSATGRDTDRDPLTYLWTYSILSGGGGGDGHGDHDHGAAPTATGQEFVIPGNGSRVSASFESAGKYLVKVRATDPKGGESVADTTIDVSTKIPPLQIEETYEGTLAAGTGGAGASQKLWGAPADAPDTNVDAVRHTFELRYPASAIAILQWNDTAAQQAGMAAFDLDLELVDRATGDVLFSSQTRIQPGPPPTVPPPYEFNHTQLPPGAYDLVVRGYAGVQVSYTLTLFLSLQLTPELVAAAEGA